jgi:hypothetical protein
VGEELELEVDSFFRIMLVIMPVKEDLLEEVDMEEPRRVVPLGVLLPLLSLSALPPTDAIRLLRGRKPLQAVSDTTIKRDTHGS